MINDLIGNLDFLKAQQGLDLTNILRSLLELPPIMSYSKMAFMSRRAVFKLCAYLEESVTEELLLELMWKKMVSSPATM